MIESSHFGKGLKKVEFTPPPQGKTRNSEVLDSFVKYCEANPDLRFWQALLNWSGLSYIVHLGAPAAWVKCVDENGKQVLVQDTYYWEGKNE